jgi:hypothetical protein
VWMTKWKQISFKLIHNWLLFLNFGFSQLLLPLLSCFIRDSSPF